MLSRKIAPALAIFLFFLSYLAWKFYSHYNGTVISHPWMIAALAILLDLLAFFLIYIFISSITRQAKKSNRQWIEGLKANGERIRVDFSTCEIRKNDWTDHITRDDEGSRYEAPYDQHVKMADVIFSVIIFRHTDTRTGNSERFVSPNINKDPITLQVYLEQQKQTSLYVDRANRNNYYFDLDFLKEA
jgi:hypothetical protein